MIIYHNIPALNTHRMLTANNAAAQKSMEKLSSGLRINRAGDDAAGLAISEKMRAQIRGLNQAMRNAQDGISLIQTAEGALQETHAILQRMRELAVQAANDTYTTEDRLEIQKEINQLVDEIDRIAEDTEFNTKKLLNSDNGVEFTFQVGANSGQTIELTISGMKAGDLGDLSEGGTKISDLYVDVTKVDPASPNDSGVMTHKAASNAITVIQAAIQQVSSLRSKLGAYQNRLEHTINNLGTSAENLQAAESRIRDVDMAKEIMEFTRANILSQASQAMLAQANQLPQAVLQLLG